MNPSRAAQSEPAGRTRSARPGRGQGGAVRHHRPVSCLRLCRPALQDGRSRRCGPWPALAYPSHAASGCERVPERPRLPLALGKASSEKPLSDAPHRSAPPRLRLALDSYRFGCCLMSHSCMPPAPPLCALCTPGPARARAGMTQPPLSEERCVSRLYWATSRGCAPRRRTRRITRGAAAWCGGWAPPGPIPVATLLSFCGPNDVNGNLTTRS